jgi:bifunctional DNase/RNase
MIELKVDSIRVNLTTNNKIIFLKEVEGNRQMPFWLGDWEARSIAAWLQEIRSPRPEPYDLAAEAIRALGGNVTLVTIRSLEADVFYSTIVLGHGETATELDARPSDAVAMALRFGAPILVPEDLLERAGVVLGADSNEEADQAENPDVDQ